MKYNILISLLLVISATQIWAQSGVLKGTVLSSDGNPVAFANAGISKLALGVMTDSNGVFRIMDLPYGNHLLEISCIGFEAYSTKINIKSAHTELPPVILIEKGNALGEVVVTGTMKEVSRAESPIPVEILTPQFFKKNPTPSLFEAVGMINGVQPQLNCNVCNTGDIHINGMEGPYTMVLIDGMPIVSSLATVYGLSGIPNSMVERIEVVKGPASSLYGSEAMGGIINVITKNPQNAPAIGIDIFGTSWSEFSGDASLKFGFKKIQSLLGINYYNYQNPVDKNKDGFTDVTLQNRVSVFNKWNFKRSHNRIANIAARYVYENRWGGQMNWNRQHRGSDSIYGESITTRRAEVLGAYQLPVKESIMTQFSYNWHDQDSYYGKIPFIANQQVVFGQIYWDRTWGKNHSWLLGASLRYTYYDDNTPATMSADSLNNPAKTPLPGIYIQDEWAINPYHKLLLGYRYDYDLHHGNIHSPRIAYKLSPNSSHTIRASFGTGFRVVNLFTEDHAALSGARKVVIAEKLNPEKSYNANLNYVLKIPADGYYLGVDITGFYSYFTNKIVGDFDSDPSKIIYDNLKGHAISQGISLNADANFSIPLKLLVGVTYMDVYLMEDNGLYSGSKNRQLQAPEWSGTFTVSYTFPRQRIFVDFTGKWNGPMRLPILPNDFRNEYSPWFCIANIQVTKKFERGLEVYGGIKNILNFVPKNPIMRPFDPFNKMIDDPVNNPYGYTFDPSYNYAPLQGARLFLGIRYNLFRAE